MRGTRCNVRLGPRSREEEGGSIMSWHDYFQGDRLMLYSVVSLQVNCGARASRDSKEKIMAFGFDYCYWSVNPEDPHYASQEMVFQDLGTAVLAGAAQGYNICLFAYGQTGSGKTYTMMGTPASVGLTPRICELTPSSFLTSSFLEIYNERVRDLLKQSDQKKPFTLRVREHPEAGPYVQGLSQHVVTNYEQVVRLLEEGIANRITAATHVHEASSRSHAIFTIHYTQVSTSCNTPSEIASKISLVDLAGSERANPSSCKPQLTEGSSINRSLMTLGIVISTLAQNSQSSARMGEPSKSTTSSPGASRVRGSTRRQPYIPYRDSVLTWLLRDSLGGNSQTIMVATVSPAHSSYRETISTLRYASSAKNIINQPQVNEDANVKLIRELRKEIDCLKTMLLSLEMIGHQTQEWAEMWSAWDTLLKQYQVDGIMEKAGEATDPSLPHLLALDSDVLSPGVVLYRLREGTTRIGRIDSDQEQDIVLQGQWIERNHCTIRSVCGEVTLQPAQGARCAVNGKEVIDACRLSQGDIIKLGKAQKFRFNHPAEAAILRQRRLVSSGVFHLLLGMLSPVSALSRPITIPALIKSDAEPGEPQPKLLEQEVVLRGQIRQQLVVKDLRQLRRTGPGQVEREVELDQTLISKQIKDNQQWLNREQAWLTALQLRWPEDPEAQTEPGASNETENRVRWGPPARSCPAARDRKGLVQLPLLRGDAPRSADPGARCRRVKSPPEKTVRKQKRLEAQRRLKWLDALGWLRKKNARQFPELDPSTGAVITRPRRRSVCPRTGSQHPRGSCSWPLAQATASPGYPGQRNPHLTCTPTPSRKMNFPENSSPPHEATLHRFAWRQPSTDLELRDWGADPWFGEGGDGISSDPGSSLLGDSLLCTRARVETQQSDQEGSSEQRVFPELENSETEDSQLSQDSLADKGLGKPTLSSGEQGGGGAEASPPASPNASERELSRLERSFSLDSLSDAEGMTVEELLEKPGSEFPEEVPAEIFWHRQRPQLPVVCQEEMASPRAWARETRAKGALGLQMSTSFYLAPSPQPLGQKRQIEMPEFFSPIAGGVDTDSWGSRGSQSNLGGPQGAAGSFRASHSAQGAHLDEREGPSGWRKLGGLKKWPGCRQLPEAPQLPQGRRGEGKGLSQATWGAKAAGEGSKLTVKAGNTPSRRLDGRKYPCGPAGIHQATAPASSISPSGGCWERVWPDAQAGRLFNLSPSAPGALAESRPNFCCPERHPSGASPGLPEATGDPNFHNNFFRLSPVRQLRAEHERDGVGPGPRDEVSVFWGATQEAGLRDYPPTALEARHPDPGEPPVCPAENGVPDSIQEAFDVKQGLSGGGAQLCRTAGVTAACREGVFLWAKEGFQPAARARRGENSAGELVLLCSGSSLAHPLEKMYSRQVSAEEIDRDEREVYVKDPELSPHPPYWSQPLPPSTASSEAACQDALTESALEPQGRTAPEVARDSNRDCPFLTEFDWKGDPAAFLQAECSEASLSLPGSPSSRAVQQGPGEASKSHGRPGEYNHSVSFSMAQERPFPQDASEEVGDLNDSPGNATQNFTHPGPGHQGEPAVQVLWPSTASKSGKMNCPLAAAAGGGQWPPLNIAGRAPDDPVPQAGALSGETWNSGYNLGLSLHNTSPGDEGLKDGRVPLGSNPATRGQSHPVPSVRETPSPPRAGSEAVLGSKGNSVEFVFPAEVTTPEEPDLGKEWESRKGREGENVPRKSLLTSLSERINDDEMAKLRSSLPQLENDIWEIRSIQRGPRLAAPPPGGPAEAGGGARADLGMIHLFLNPEDFRSDLAHGDQSVFAKKVQGEGGPRSGKAATAAEETDSCSQRDQSKTSSCRDQSGTNNCSREEPDLGSCSPRDEPEKDGGSHGDQPETEICSQEEPETHTSNHRDEQENDGCGHGDRQTQKSPQPAPNPGDCPEQNQFESEHIHPAESPVVTQDGLGSGGTGERPRFSQRASQNPVTPGGWDSRPTATRFAEILEAGDPLEMEGKMGFRGSSFPGKVINSEGALGVLRAQGGRDEEWDPLKRVRSQEEDKGAPWSREPPSPGRARARGQPKYQDSARPLQAQKGSVGHPRRGDSESTLSLDSPEVSSPETPGPSGAAARDPDLDSDGDSPSEAGAVAGVERRERGEGRPESQNPPGPPARGSAEDHQAVEGSTRLPSGTAAWGQAETSLLLGENKETRNFSCRDYGGGREAAERNWDPSGGIVCEADSEAVVGNTERRNPVGGPPGTEALPAPELKPLSFRGGAKEERREAAALSANELPEASPEPLGLAQASSRKSQAGAGLYEALGNHSEEHLAQGITRPHSETESGDAAGSRGPLVRYRQNGVQADILRGQSEPPKPSEHPRATADPVRDPSGPRWRLHVIQGGTRGSPLESEAPPNRAARSTSPASSNPGGRTVPGWGWGGPDGDLKTEEKLKGYLDPSGPGPLHDPPASEKELASSASREGGRGQPLSGRRSLDLSSSPVEVQRGLSQAKGGTAAAVVEPQWEGSGLRGQRAGVAGPGQSRGPVGSARLGGPLRTATSLPVPDAASAHHPTAGSPVPQVAKVICLGETQPRECGPAASSHQAAAAPAGSGPSGALSARGAFWTDTTLDSEGNVRSGQTEACGKWSPPFPSPARDSICPGGTEEGPEHRKFQDQGGCRALSLLEAEEETCAARQLSRTRTEPLRSPLAVGNQHVEPPVDVPEADSPLPEARGTPGGPIPPVACFPATQMGLLSEGSEARELPTALSHGLERGNTLRAAPGSHPLQRTSPGSRRDSDKGDRYPGNSPPVVSPGLWEPGKLTSCRSAELPGEAVHPTIPQGRDPGDTASSKEKESSLPPSEAASPRTGAGEQEPRAASPHIYSGSGYRPPVHGAKRLPSSEAAPWEGPSTSTPGARARGDSPDSNRRRVGSPWKQEQKPNQLPRPRGRRNPPQAGSAGGARHSRARGAVRSKRKRLKLVSNRNNPSPLGFRSAGSRRIPHRAPVVLLQAVDGPGGLGGQEEQGARAPPGHSSPQPGLGVSSKPGLSPPASSGSLRDLSMSVEPPSPSATDTWGHEAFWAVGPGDSSPAASADSTLQETREAWGAADCGQTPSRHGPEPASVPSSSSRASPAEPTPDGGAGRAPDGPGPGKPAPACCEGGVAAHSGEERDLPRFRGSDVTPYLCCRQLGGAGSGFGSVGVISGAQVPGGLEPRRLTRCSSLGSVATSQSSPFHSHLNTYAGAWGLSRTPGSSEGLQSEGEATSGPNDPSGEAAEAAARASAEEPDPERMQVAVRLCVAKMSSGRARTATCERSTQTLPLPGRNRGRPRRCWNGPAEPAQRPGAGPVSSRDQAAVCIGTQAFPPYLSHASRANSAPLGNLSRQIQAEGSPSGKWVGWGKSAVDSSPPDGRSGWGRLGSETGPHSPGPPNTTLSLPEDPGHRMKSEQSLPTRDPRPENRSPGWSSPSCSPLVSWATGSEPGSQIHGLWGSAASTVASHSGSCGPLPPGLSPRGQGSGPRRACRGSSLVDRASSPILTLRATRPYPWLPEALANSAGDPQEPGTNPHRARERGGDSSARKDPTGERANRSGAGVRTCQEKQSLRPSDCPGPAKIPLSARLGRPQVPLERHGRGRPFYGPPARTLSEGPCRPLPLEGQSGVVRRSASCFLLPVTSEGPGTCSALAASREEAPRWSSQPAIGDEAPVSPPLPGSHCSWRPPASSSSGTGEGAPGLGPASDGGPERTSGRGLGPQCSSLKDLPVHDKFSDWSGVRSSSPRGGAGGPLEGPEASLGEPESRSQETPRPQRQLARVGAGIQPAVSPLLPALSVELAEAKLHYGLGATDALLQVLQSGMGEALAPASPTPLAREELYGRHAKAIEALRRERAERFRRPRAQSLSPQKDLSLQPAQGMVRDAELPSQRRDYLQQLRKDVVATTRQGRARVGRRKVRRRLFPWPGGPKAATGTSSAPSYLRPTEEASGLNSSPLGALPAFPRYQCEEQEVLVYYKAFPSSTRHSFLGAGVVPLPLPCVWAAVRDPTLRPLYDKAVRIAQLHRRVTGSIQLVYLVSSTSPCFSKQPRDFCCVSVEAREGSLAVSAARSVSDPSMPRPRRGLVRGEILPSAWLLQPDTVDGRDVTRVIHLTQVELGGPGLPARPRSSFVKCQPLAIAGLAAFLLG
uniref:Kinesin motor domain-containing protein n=1 Tax=Ornithorhynchus anatinus TaxID=9258 RepID=K7E9Z3_ORNAN